MRIAHLELHKCVFNRRMIGDTEQCPTDFLRRFPSRPIWTTISADDREEVE